MDELYGNDNGFRQDISKITGHHGKNASMGKCRRERGKERRQEVVQDSRYSKCPQLKYVQK